MFVGDINVVDTLINTEFRITVLERVIDRLLRVAPPGTLTAQDIENIRKETVAILQKKYPNSGITFKSG